MYLKNVGLGVNGVLHFQGAPPVFSTLYRRLCLARDHRVSGEIMSQRRLLDPGEALLVKHTREARSKRVAPQAWTTRRPANKGRPRT